MCMTCWRSELSVLEVGNWKGRKGKKINKIPMHGYLGGMGLHRRVGFSHLVGSFNKCIATWLLQILLFVNMWQLAAVFVFKMKGFFLNIHENIFSPPKKTATYRCRPEGKWREMAKASKKKDWVISDVSFTRSVHFCCCCWSNRLTLKQDNQVVPSPFEAF